jgi:hypothetical protein
MSKTTVQRFIKLINNDIIFGEMSGNEQMIFIEKPFTVIKGQVMPYMMEHTNAELKALEVHQMNILWSVPLDEFPAICDVYNKALDGITSDQPEATPSIIL